jgi:hypothetical protein
MRNDKSGYAPYIKIKFTFEIVVRSMLLQENFHCMHCDNCAQLTVLSDRVFGLLPSAGIYRFSSNGKYALRDFQFFL